jgi:hypothetical protein
MGIGNGKWPPGSWMVSKTKKTPSSVQRREGERSRRGAKGEVVEDDEGFLKMVGVPLAAVRGGWWILVRQHAVETLASQSLTV